MKKLILLFFVVFLSKISRAAWVNLNTGINDNLTGVVFWGNKGLVSGHHGLYYTTNGGNGPTSWTRFNITGNQSDSILYNRTKFNHAYSANNSGIGNNLVFACGKDTIANKAVVMKLNLSTMTYSVLYIGNSNTSLNKITYSYYDSQYYAVGENGLIIKFNGNVNAVIPSTFSSNLNSISFSGNNFLIGSNSNIINGISSAGLLSYNNIYNASSYNIKDVICYGLGNSFGVGKSYFKYNNTSLLDQPSYDFGQLNGNTMIDFANCQFVGTDHGIFKSNSFFYFLEWQPSSLNYSINGFWYNNINTSLLYACGKNGVVLYTTDNGGLSKPYAEISLTGGCLGAPTLIAGITGTSTNCKWYINNVLSSSSCNGLTKVFNSVGQYTIQVNVSNGLNSYDTAVGIINIVDYPKINKPISLSKSILCQQEAIIVSVDSSEQNVFYTLKKIGNGLDYGSSMLGNLSQISFTSNVLSASGNYYIQATNTLAPCYKNFTDTIQIVVEKTKADFYVATINANPNETVNCFEHCTDAQNFNWIFSPGGLSSNQSSPTPSVAFVSTGSTQVKLIAWSNNGCYDTIQKNGPRIYVEPTNIDSCWSITNNGTDLPWSGYYNNVKDISQLSPSRSGFITCGFYHDEVFASNYGDSLRLPNGQGGAYIAKYNQNGVLKWLNREVNYSGNEYLMTSAVEDKNGNIYSTVHYFSKFRDNRGDIYKDTSGSSFIFKFDSLGQVIWRLSLDVAFGSSSITGKIFVDHAGDIYFICGAGFSNMTLTLNGIATDSITNIQTPYVSAIFKISSSGHYIWHNSIGIGVAPDNVNITFDANNNLYVTGTCLGGIILFNAPGSTFSQTISIHPANTGPASSGIFIVKYDVNGTLIWKMGSSSQSTTQYLNTYSYSSATDSIGNTYITGRNGCKGTNVNQTFDNTDGSVSLTNSGEYFIAKVNNAGICKWIQGNQSSYYGFGHGVYQEGNEVGVLGQIKDNSVDTILTNTFTSADNNNINLTIAHSNLFVAVYDTIGNIKRIIVNAGNQPYVSDEYGFNGFYKVKQGSYRFARNIETYYPYINFGDIIPLTNKTDGTMTTFSENCGIVVTSSTVSCVSPTLVVNAASICIANTATLTADGASSYSWIPNATLNASTDSIVNVSPNVNTTYTIIGGTGACMTLTTTTVSIINTPTLSVVNSGSVCSGNTVTLTASGVTTYTWSSPASNSSSVYVTPNTTTIYTVTGNTPGCSDTYSASSSVSVAITPTINIISSSTVVCAGESVTLTPNGANSYTWTNGVTGGVGFVPSSSNIYTVIGSILSCTSSASDSIIVTPCAGIKENEDFQEIVVFPNPTKNFLYLNISDHSNILIRVINLLGQNIDFPSNSTIINMEGFSPGVYNLLIYKENRLYHQEKIIKE